MNPALSLLKFYEHAGYVKSKKVKEGFLKVDRKKFVPENLRQHAYDDRPLPITAEATISAPHMHLIYLEELQLKKGQKVLEIGFGSGILLAYLVEIVGAGNVYGVEIDPLVYEFGKRNLERTGYLSKVKVYLSDGSKGLKEHAPYDRIAVSASSKKIYKTWVDQLRDGGILLVPLGRFDQWLYKVRKMGKKIEKQRLMPVSFVELKRVSLT